MADSQFLIALADLWKVCLKLYLGDAGKDSVSQVVPKVRPYKAAARVLSLPSRVVCHTI